MTGRGGPQHPRWFMQTSMTPKRKGRIMRSLTRSCLLLAGLVAVTRCGDSERGTQPADPDSGAAMAFADSALERVVRTSLNRPAGDLTQAELLSLTELQAQSLGIEDLAGIERLGSLNSLHLGDNTITDVTPLTTLIELQWLDLSSNHIQDISALASLVGLVLLDLDGNRIRDLSPLSELPGLETLFLNENEIIDVSPLMDMRSLQSVELSGNPVSQGALTGLAQRGVEVTFRSDETEDGDPEDPLGLSRMPGRIVFYSWRSDRGDVYIMDPDGSNETKLTSDEAWISDPCISPDGSRVAFTARAEREYDIFVLNVGTGETVGLGIPGIPYGASWSPDGTKVAFHSHLPGENSPSIFVIDPDGSGMTRVTQEDRREDRYPTWSPDGRIAFRARVGWGKTSNLDILMIGVDGSDETNVTNSPDNEETPAWSPDGGRIAYAHGGQIYVLNLASQSVVPLTQGTEPTWSPDGRLLAFHRSTPVGAGIWAIEVASCMEAPIGKPGHPSDNHPSWSVR